MEQLSHIFKALSEPLRLRIMHLLLQNGKEAYGEELAGALGIPAYQLSRHLKVLKATGLVNERREGRWVYYSLAKHPGNGYVLGLLRRLLAEAKVPVTHGNGHQTATRRRKQRPTRPSDEFNWNEGPAIPGIL